MKKNLFSSIIFLLAPLSFCAQTKLKPIEELLVEGNPGWTLVAKWIDSAKNSVEIIPTDSINGKEELRKIQVTTRSTMGSIVYKTAGILVDSGWIRILGAGNSPQINRSIHTWNIDKGIRYDGKAPDYLAIADDVLGGFFLLNGGGLGPDFGKIYYFAPQTLLFEPLNITYSEFLLFCFNQNLDSFYMGYRWPNWKSEVKKLSADSTFSFYPFLWTEQAKEINKLSKYPVPVSGQWFVNLQARKSLGLDKK